MSERAELNVSEPNSGKPNSNPSNTALVVGAGVAGMQAALILAARGHDVVLADRAAATGGLFPLLDNQFPTQSCGVCFMACDTPTYCPFVQCDLHENISVLTRAEVTGVTGEAGAFSVEVSRRPSGVDNDKCTDCGACEAVCPVEVEREFGEGLETRKAIYRYYPKAVGKSFAVDFDSCTRCGKCVEACESAAIDLDASSEKLPLEAGVVILSPGAETFDTTKKGEYGAGRYANVLSAVKFERMLAKGGPTGGNAVRPSDGSVADSLAFIQCVGSRDSANGRAHCSSVCCMFTLKQALFAKERHPDLRVAVYYMDLRAFGKDYEDYIRRAKALGIEFINAMPSTLRLVPSTQELQIETTFEGCNDMREERYSMVVLASGFEQGSESKGLCASFGLEADVGGLVTSAELDEFNPCATDVKGIFAAGVFRGTKDIPESTREGAAAAALASALLETGVQPELPTCPTPADFSDEAPKTAVALCKCDGYISSRVDMEALAKRVSEMTGVEFVKTFDHACSKAGMNEVRAFFGESEPNRLVLAGCSNRLIQDLYAHMFTHMGVHPGVVEISDLRRACLGGEEAAQQEVAHAASSSFHNDFAPRRRHAASRSALVVGGGAAGMGSALALADLGHTVHLVEKSAALGGNLLTGSYTLKGNEPQKLVAALAARVGDHENIEQHLSSSVKSSEGRLGAFRTTLATPKGAVEVLHGAVVLATGANEVKPVTYGYGDHPRIVTQKEFESKVAAGEFTGGNVVMIQCVESREEVAESTGTYEGDFDRNCRPYCSRVCCTHAIKNGRKALEVAPDAQVSVLYRDLRAYGNFERSYQAARDERVRFTHFDLEHRPEVTVSGEEISVGYVEPSLDEVVKVVADWLVLSVGMTPAAESVTALAELFGAETVRGGFFLEKNAKAATTDLTRPGVYVAGTAYAPLHIEETLVHARAAAGRLAALLCTEELESSENVSYVVDRLCSRCGLCVEACPYGARELNFETGLAEVDDMLCRACGACVTACPNKAARQYGSAPGQIMASLDELL
jgi:heterodisulfide reductase subunit A